MYMIVLHVQPKRFEHKHLYHKEIKAFCKGFISARNKIDYFKGLRTLNDGNCTRTSNFPIL